MKKNGDNEYILKQELNHIRTFDGMCVFFNLVIFLLIFSSSSVTELVSTSAIVIRRHWNYQNKITQWDVYKRVLHHWNLEYFLQYRKTFGANPIEIPIELFHEAKNISVYFIPFLKTYNFIWKINNPAEIKIIPHSLINTYEKKQHLKII